MLSAFRLWRQSRGLKIVPRGMGLLLGLLVIASALFVGWYSSSRQTYFDPSIYSRPWSCSIDRLPSTEFIDPEIENWWGSPLRAVNEPSLFSSPPTDGKTSVRFTFLPAFVSPIIVRLDDVYGATPRMTAHRVVGQVVSRPGVDLIERDLTASEARSIQAFLEESSVLNLQPDGCISGIDGVIYLIEANGPDGYRFINRWGPLYGSVYELSNLMFGLTGWPNGEQGPDRWQDGGPSHAFVLTGVGRFAVFADVRSIVRQGDVVRMRSLQVVEEDFKIGDVAYWGGLSWWSFDCRLRTADRLDFASVALGGIEGPATLDSDPAITASPGGDAEELLNVACAREWPLPDSVGIWDAVSLGREQLAAA